MSEEAVGSDMLTFLNRHRHIPYESAHASADFPAERFLSRTRRSVSHPALGRGRLVHNTQLHRLLGVCKPPSRVCLSSWLLQSTNQAVLVSSGSLLDSEISNMDIRFLRRDQHIPSCWL